MAMALADLLNTTTNVMVLPVKQREVLSNYRYETISTIIYWKYKSIREWCTTKYNLKTAIWGASYRDQKIKGLQALEWWATYFTLRGKQIILSNYDVTMMEYCIDEAKLD